MDPGDVDVIDTDPADAAAPKQAAGVRAVRGGGALEPGDLVEVAGSGRAGLRLARSPRTRTAARRSAETDVARVGSLVVRVGVGLARPLRGARGRRSRWHRSAGQACGGADEQPG